jgi:hypothetical protein
MRVEPRASDVRRLVVKVFRNLGAPPPSLFDLEEEILIDAGRYLGRSYRADNLMAMWLAEIGLVQFYDSEGNMLRTVNLLEEVAGQRIAA